MLTRREVLRDGAIWLALAGAACDRSAPPPPPEGPKEAPARPRAAEGPRTRTIEGVVLHELFPAGGDESSPVVAAIHGRGDHPLRWVETWRSFPRAAHVVVPRAFTPFGDGFSWFELRPGMTQEEIAAALGEAEAKLWPAIAKVAGTRPITVTGFSQGGMLSFAMAARHGDRVARAFPVAGACPASLLPPPSQKAAPVVAFHGTSDPVIAFAKGKDTVEALAKSGHEATLRAYPGVGHTITAEMHTQIWQEIAKSLA